MNETQTDFDKYACPECHEDIIHGDECSEGDDIVNTQPEGDMLCWYVEGTNQIGGYEFREKGVVQAIDYYGACILAERYFKFNTDDILLEVHTVRQIDEADYKVLAKYVS